MGTYSVSANLNDRGEFKLEIFVASCMAITVSLLLKPIGMPRVLSKIIAGIILGPSFLGHIPGFQRILFPCHDFSSYLEIYSTVGLMFRFFLDGVQIRPSMAKTLGRQGLVMGFSMLVLPASVSLFLAFLVSKIGGLTLTETKNLELVGIMESLSTFSVVTYFLHELEIINSKFGRVAYSAALVSNVLGLAIVMTIQMLGHVKRFGLHGLLKKFGRYIPLAIIVIYILRPLNRRMDEQMQEGQPLRHRHLSIVIALIMCVTIYCMFFNINPMYGPFIYGLTIPAGSRMGSSLLRRLEPFNTWIIMPIFYTQVGSEVDIFSPKSAKAFPVVLVILFSYASKVLGAYVPARIFNMSHKESILLGIAVNSQGFVELFVYTSMYHRKYIDKDCYAIIVMSIVVLTGASTPIMRNLYKYTLENEGSSINTIQHAQPHDHFRVLACIHSEEMVPSFIHLLKSSNPSKYSPINLTVVHLMNLVGVIPTPVFVNHKLNEDNTHIPAPSHRIIKAFTNHEENDPGTMIVHPYTVVTPYATMHTDVHMLALQKRPFIIIIPFYKKLSTGEVDAGLKTVNNKVLDDAPCSVGILIDRGLHTSVAFDRESSFRCNVAVVFLGGADDREALAYAARMCGHQNIELSVFRFLKSGFEESTPMRDSILDDEMLTEFKLKTANNPRVAYIEEAVSDGVGVIEVIEAMESNFDLILLGRHHDISSPLVQELTEWDSSELGMMGDIFVNSNYGGNATILVVQQQRRAATRLASQTKDIQVCARSCCIF